MKGLLLKDFYLIRSLLFIMVIVFMIIGTAMAYLSSPWVLIVIGSMILGMIVTTTINLDKTSGWWKVAMTLPVKKAMIVHSKYLLYGSLSLFGMLFGLVISFSASSLFHHGDVEAIPLFVCISITMSLLGGSILLPCYFLFHEEKSILGAIIAYPLAAGIFIMLIWIFGKSLQMCVIAMLLGLFCYMISWFLSKELLIRRDIQ